MPHTCAVNEIHTVNWNRNMLIGNCFWCKVLLSATHIHNDTHRTICGVLIERILIYVIILSKSGKRLTSSTYL